ncbi:MAG: hypothetical protein HY959_07795 [Ignavibacteriae bacterium]|nr:hypothetical protein [Ignavibacteriota bacterium]
MLIASEKFKSKIKNAEFIKTGNLFISTGNEHRINESILFSGEIDYVTVNEQKRKFRGDFSDAVKAVESGNAKKIYDSIEGSFYFIKISSVGISFYTDRYCKKDIFYFSEGNDFLISDTLECFFETGLAGEFVPVSLVAFFTLYGNYPPKKHTLHSGISRLGVNETLTVSGKGLKIIKTENNLHGIKDYNNTNLEEYYELLFSAVKNRSSENGINWIYLSSGWDSTSILTLLKQAYPSEQIRGVIGEMIYSERSGVINKFEVDRAKAFADYYGIKLDVVPLDYTKQDIIASMNTIVPFMKNNLVNSFNTFNFFMLSDFIGRNAGKDDVVFSGEISDGVHNLGFSQYATILDHPDLGFREYADKMSSYLFGPSFLKAVNGNNYEKDIIYNFLKNRYGAAKFGSVLNLSKEKQNTEMLASFFLAPRRIPFYGMENMAMFTEKARNEYLSVFKSEYLNEYGKNLSTENIYSAIIHLYNSFHWQGSTVKVIGKSLGRFGKDIKLPFWDTGIQDFLSQMPESWGRGLDFNSTKFPLKWILKNKTDYPIHLQKGPHSYLYDVNPGFSHLAEVLYGKRLNSYFKNLLQDRKFNLHLTGDYFNQEYLNGITGDYLNGTELGGQKLNDLGSLVLFSLIL